MCFKLKNVLITGGAGYIGTVLVKKLLFIGYKVRVIDNFSSGNNDALKQINNGNLEVIYGDISDSDNMDKALKNIDYVFALAAIVGDAACGIDNQYTERINFESTNILIDLSKKHKIKHIFFTSSCSVYGSQNDVLNEQSILNPLTIYARTRVNSENELLNSGLNVTIVRLATVHGWSERMRFDLQVNLFSGQGFFGRGINVYGGGGQWRPYVHVSDVAEALYFLLKTELNQKNHEIFNIGSEENNMTILQIATEVKNLIPSTEINVVSSKIDKRNYIVNFDKIEKLGFKAKLSVVDGIIEMIDKLKTIEVNFNDDKYYNGNIYKKIHEYRLQE